MEGAGFEEIPEDKIQEYEVLGEHPKKDTYVVGSQKSIDLKKKLNWYIYLEIFITQVANEAIELISQFRRRPA